MKTISLNDTGINNLNPELVVVVSCNYKGAVQARSGAEILKEYRKVFPAGPLADALSWWTGETSEDFTIVVVWNGKPLTVVRI